MKNRFKIASTTLLSLLVLGLASCGGNNPTPTPTSQSGESSAAPASSASSALKITLKLPKGQSELTLKVGSNTSAGQYWTVTKEGGNPTSAEKKVLAVSSDPTVLAIAETSATSNPTFQALKPGEVTVTVTLNKDSTQSIVIPVVVEDSFFDYRLSTIHEGDNIDEEMPESRLTPGGKVELSSYLDSSLIVKDSSTTGDFYIEGKIVVGSLDGTDDYSKIGIEAIDLDNSLNSVRFFFDTNLYTEQKQIKTAWDAIGTVECSAGTTFGWQLDYPNNTARHTDFCYGGAGKITPTDTITIGMVRKAEKFHCFVNGGYAFTWVALDSIAKDANGDPRAFYAGFWNFNGIAYTMQDYLYSQDQTVVNSKVALISGGENIIDRFDGKTR